MREWGSMGAAVLLIAAVLAGPGCRLTSAPGPGGSKTAPAAASADEGKRAVEPDTRFTLARLRATFETQIFVDEERYETPTPPREIFELVRYPAPLGANAAYVSPPASGPRRPAIVWINGGFSWGTGGWTQGPRENDQSAMIFHQPGIVLMRPSLRGAQDNPGRNECFLGEVDDILAALAYLRERDDVDPDRIYLGGHSTGATMALLVAESTSGFRAVFAFGPVADPLSYGKASCLPAGTAGLEGRLRAPIHFVSEIRTPTYLIEGSEGNADSCRALIDARGSAPVELVEIPGADHFNVIAPGSEVVAAAILADTGESPDLAIDAGRIQARFGSR